MMALSCDCGDFDPSNFDHWWESPNDYTEMPERRVRVRCVSCRTLIDAGAVVIEFERFRHANEFEENKLGLDEVPLASKWMCETCGDIFFSLSELGFCMNVDEQSMQETLAEYHEFYGPNAEVSNAPAQ